MVAGPPAPERPAKALDGAQVLVAAAGSWAIFLPGRGVPARWNDRLGAPHLDGVAAGAAATGAVGSDRRDRLAFGDLRQQAGQHGCVADPAVVDFHGSDPERALVDGEMHLAPFAPPRAAVLARMPFALAPDLDPGAVDQQVQQPA